MFTRTNDGLSNAHIFHGVQAIVYVEGGSPVQENDELGEEEMPFASMSDDIRFWQSIFDTYLPGSTFLFRSLGGKPNLYDMASKISSGDIQNTIVAFDRDFDNICGTLIHSENILYTYGYSWENDVWSVKNTKEAVYKISGACKVGKREVGEDFVDRMEILSACIYRAVRLDAILFEYGSSFFDRDRFRQYLEISENSPPKIRKERIRSTLNRLRNPSRSRTVANTNLDLKVAVDCYGHLWESMCYHTLAYYIRVRAGRKSKFTAQSAAVVLLQVFSADLLANKESTIAEHYRNEIGKVIC